MTTESLIEVSKVSAASVAAVILASLTDIKEILSIISLLVAIGYAVYRWIDDVTKAKERKIENKKKNAS